MSTFDTVAVTVSPGTHCDAQLDLLSDDERARLGRLRFEANRQEFAVAHALLRTMLSEFGSRAPADWTIEPDENGKPTLASASSGASMTFNLSHSHGLVACAVALDARVGVDVESVIRATDWRLIASRHYADAEVVQIDTLRDDERPARFFDFWTLKEAYAKALGVGLSQPLETATFDLRDPQTPAWSISSGADPRAWHFALYRPLPDYRLAVAVSDGTSRRWHLDVRAVDETGRVCEPLHASVA